MLVLILLVSCNKEDMLTPNEQFEVDLKLIQDYLTKNNLTAQQTNSGLHYIVTEEGSGTDYPTINDKIKVHYKGFYIDSEEVFDQNFDISDPNSFELARTIKGWREGIPLFKRGAKGMLLIPSILAYGPYPENGIKPNATLVFEIELLDFFQ